MTTQKEFLKSIPYFSGLEPGLLEEIRRSIFEKKYERAEIILLEGEPAQSLFFLNSGAVKVFKTSPEGKEQILSIVRPGESFNDISVFDGGLNPASAQAMGGVDVYGISRKDMEGLLKKHPEVARNVLQVMAKRVRELVALVEDLSFRHVMGRVAKILLEYASDDAGQRPRLTQQEIAAMAGTAREVVGRSLKALEEDGLIKLESHRVVINDRNALNDLVGTPA
jgi:CRP-like cAMP-binding protein